MMALRCLLIATVMASAALAGLVSDMDSFGACFDTAVTLATGGITSQPATW